MAVIREHLGWPLSGGWSLLGGSANGGSTVFTLLALRMRGKNTKITIKQDFLGLGICKNAENAPFVMDIIGILKELV